MPIEDNFSSKIVMKQQTTQSHDGIDLLFTKIEYLRRYATNYLSYKAVDYRQLARYVSHKCLVMTGKLDMLANVVSSEKIAALIPNARLLINEDADDYGILREESDTLMAIWNCLYEQRGCAA